MKKQKERPHCLRAQTAGPNNGFVHENHCYCSITHRDLQEKGGQDDDVVH